MGITESINTVSLVVLLQVTHKNKLLAFHSSESASKKKGARNEALYYRRHSSSRGRDGARSVAPSFYEDSTVERMLPTASCYSNSEAKIPTTKKGRGELMWYPVRLNTAMHYAATAPAPQYYRQPVSVAPLSRN